MNKQVVIGVVILLLLIGGVAYFMRSRPPANFTPAPGITAQTQTETPITTPTPSKKSLKDLLDMGQSQQCTFTTAVGNSGVVYISGGKSRGDFTSVANEQTIKSHMISDGQYTYVWMDGQAQGFKSAVNTSTTPQPSTAASGSIDVNQSYNYDCTSWTVDTSLFTPPAAVEFLSPATY